MKMFLQYHVDYQLGNPIWGLNVQKVFLLALGHQYENPNTVIETLEEVLFKAAQPNSLFRIPDWLRSFAMHFTGDKRAFIQDWRHERSNCIKPLITRLPANKGFEFSAFLHNTVDHVHVAILSSSVP